ncbi:SDR family NAD(P)-dependent oxidoreductase [Parvibaculum sp.]|uniref:SDR family NAD(P)-dependent oxidoreductase n=1 Tax=Parvibaculum sp. TaxID=2024848 RepID=UPI002CBFDB36|nr:SDR family oxidoreductase [Parvibaculum sp.]HUD53494.1 SDR family oxidoreductase [Parvibaculum sp.]
MSESFRYSDDELATLPAVYAPDLLKGQVFVVSGGGSGIGRATAWLAARLGAKVVVTGRKEEKLVAMRDGLTAHGFSADYAMLDIRDRDSVDGALTRIMAREGRIDTLVNSAGGQFPQAAIDYSLKGWRAVIETNLDGTFHMMQSMARLWRDKGAGGNIVNIVVSGRGLHHVAHSVAARAGVIAFSEAVAVEWAPLGIRINCIAPGAIRSEGWATYAPDVRERYPNTNPLRKVGTPWDVAQACIYLSAPSGQFVTGETLEITGGGHLWGEVWTTDKPGYFIDASRKIEPKASE